LDACPGWSELYGKVGGNIVAVGECDPDLAHKYGIVGKGEDLDGGFRITEMVEKPAKGTAPSNYFINGRYILQPEIFEILAQAGARCGQRNPGHGRDAEARRHAALSPPIDLAGETYDCGSKDGLHPGQCGLCARPA
jgi:UTP--glucose-1-phosphate uridylyltransferase